MLIIKNNSYGKPNFTLESDSDYLKIKKIYSNISNVYSEIEMIGIDEKNDTVKIFCKYWKDNKNVRKELFDGDDTVITTINDTAVGIYYTAADVMINTNINDMDVEEREEFMQQNLFLDYYTLDKLKQKYVFINKKVEGDFLYYNFTLNENNIAVIFNKNNFLLHKIILKYNNENMEGEMNILFKKLKLETEE